nr:hypothetical protein [Tanacetum cinerariifolium]
MSTPSPEPLALLLLGSLATFAEDLSLEHLEAGAVLDLKEVTVNDDFGKSRITHVIVLLRVLVLHSIYQREFPLQMEDLQISDLEFRADLEHVSEVFKVKSVTFVVHFETK